MLARVILGQPQPVRALRRRVCSPRAARPALRAALPHSRAGRRRDTARDL